MADKESLLGDVWDTVRGGLNTYLDYEYSQPTMQRQEVQQPQVITVQSPDTATPSFVTKEILMMFVMVVVALIAFGFVAKSL